MRTVFILCLLFSLSLSAFAQGPQTGHVPRKPGYPTTIEEAQARFPVPAAIQNLPVFQDTDFTPDGTLPPELLSLVNKPFRIEEGSMLPVFKAPYVVRGMRIVRTRFAYDKRVVGYKGWMLIQGVAYGAPDDRARFYAMPIEFGAVLSPDRSRYFFSPRPLPAVGAGDGVLPVTGMFEWRGDGFHSLAGVQSAVQMPPALKPVQNSTYGK